MNVVLVAARKLSGGQKLVFKVNVGNLLDEDCIDKEITRGQQLAKDKGGAILHYCVLRQRAAMLRSRCSP
ncbi:MAG: hypothetical protein KF715_17775 [Candidatus Didemnitutus sp.]|nr:hypothetical protein [Candidatus Didemnitutus sp.]